MEDKKPEKPEAEKAPPAGADQTFKPTLPKQPTPPEAAKSEPEKAEPAGPAAAKPETPKSEGDKPAGEDKPLPPEKKRPGFWTRAFRWLVGILILLGLGATLILIAFYLPSRRLVDRQNQQIADMTRSYEADLASAQDEIASLKKLAVENDELKAENKSLQEEIERALIHLTLVQVRSDVISAQVALMRDPPNPGEARLALSNTAELLEELKEMLPENVDRIQAMLDRLDTVMEEMDSDPELAILDLGSLLNDLLWLENAVVR